MHYNPDTPADAEAMARIAADRLRQAEYALLQGRIHWMRTLAEHEAMIRRRRAEAEQAQAAWTRLRVATPMSR